MIPILQQTGSENIPSTITDGVKGGEIGRGLSCLDNKTFFGFTHGYRR